MVVRWRIRKGWDPKVAETKPARPQRKGKLTINTRKVTKAELKLVRRRQRYWAKKKLWRPKTRDDCRDVPRPCPFVGCRWNLYLDVTERGSIVMNFPEREPGDMVESCALDVAERGSHNSTEVARHMNLTRARVEQIIDESKSSLRHLRVVHDDLFGDEPHDET